LLILLSELHRQHVDLEGGVNWKSVRDLEAMEEECGAITSQLKNALAAVRS
jgi:hypothetical protein